MQQTRQYTPGVAGWIVRYVIVETLWGAYELWILRLRLRMTLGTTHVGGVEIPHPAK